MMSALSETVMKSLFANEWWKHVTPEVSSKLIFLIKNIDVLGLDFRDAFISAFKYQHIKRTILTIAVSPDQPGALFGRSMSEECYRSGCLPAKMLLELEDWTYPNDADVKACMMICSYIDAFVQSGIIPDNKKNESALSLCKFS